MTDDKDTKEEIKRDLNNIGNECKTKDESGTQNLIITRYKICKSYRISKTIFPL